MPTVSDDYLKAIKLHYEVVKNDMYSGILLQASPSQLRDLCLVLHENGLNPADMEIFRSFFGTGEANLKKSIEGFDLGKYKKVQNFLLKGGTTDIKNQNLVAVLIDFNPRPLSLFLKTENKYPDKVHDMTGKQDFENGNTKEKYVEAPDIKKSNVGSAKLFPPGKRETPKQILILLSVLLLIALGYYWFRNFYQEKRCMQWQDYHYIVVDCDQSAATGNLDLVDYNEELLHFKKIIPDSTTVPYKGGAPNLWHGRGKNGRKEYFNAPGIHPETGAALEPISKPDACRLWEKWHSHK